MCDVVLQVANRDANAAENMQELLSAVLEGRQRPQRFCRKGRSPVDQPLQADLEGRSGAIERACLREAGQEHAPAAPAQASPTAESSIAQALQLLALLDLGTTQAAAQQAASE